MIGRARRAAACQLANRGLTWVAMSEPHQPVSKVSQSVSGMTSASLLHKVQARDPDAWNRLVRLYSPLVFHWCRRAGLNAEDSADILQTVFLGVATRVGDFRRETANDSFRGWLRTICRYKIADHFRAAANRPEAVGGSTAHQNLMQFAEDGDTATDADGADPSDDRGRLLTAALEIVRGDFAPTTWEAFRLYAVQGKPATEVAATLGVSLDTVYQAKARVLRRLRDEFEQLLD
jgi:RNA polymerase sigma-70 factor (ECF subfamily)